MCVCEWVGIDARPQVSKSSPLSGGTGAAKVIMNPPPPVVYPPLPPAYAMGYGGGPMAYPSLPPPVGSPVGYPALPPGTGGFPGMGMGMGMGVYQGQPVGQMPFQGVPLTQQGAYCTCHTHSRKTLSPAAGMYRPSTSICVRAEIGVSVAVCAVPMGVPMPGSGYYYPPPGSMQPQTQAGPLAPAPLPRSGFPELSPASNKAYNPFD